MRWLLLLQLGCTLAMTGIIWFVQVVHYPLFLKVSQTNFRAFEAEHATRTGWVVGPLMGLELALATLFLLQRFRPPAIPAASAWLGEALVVAIWLSTGLVQVPLHNRLQAGYDATVIASLVHTNWLRTIAWTLRSGLVLVWAAKAG